MHFSSLKQKLAKELSRNSQQLVNFKKFLVHLYKYLIKKNHLITREHKLFSNAHG